MKLVLGTVQFGLAYGIANKTGQVAPSDAASILALARAKGIRMLDTAVSYGESEACLGSCDTKDFEIVTKLPPMPDEVQDVEAWVEAQMNASLKRLGRPTLYGLLLHRSQQLWGNNGYRFVRALIKLKESGLVKKIGISIYSPQELTNVMDVCPIDIVQTPFNLIDRRLCSTGWLDRLHKNGVEIHARSVFLQGLLLIPKSSTPSKFERWNDLWCKWSEWLETHNFSPLEACLAFPLSFPQISKVVIGVDTLGQLSQVLNAEIVASRVSALYENLPDIECVDDQLINPSYWNLLES